MPARLQPEPVKEFDPTRGFCCGDLITFAGATVCRRLQLREGLSVGRPEGDKDLSNEPARVAIWLGMATFVERLREWDGSGKGSWIETGVARTHLYHMVLAPGYGIVYVHETPDRRPGMKLVSAVAVS